MDATFARNALICLTDYWTSAACGAGVAHAWVTEKRIWHVFTARRFPASERRATLTPITRSSRPGWWGWRLHIAESGYVYLDPADLHSDPCPLPAPGTVDREHRLHLYAPVMLPSRDCNTTCYASWPLTVIRARA